MPSRTEIKITIAKLLEVAYSKNKGVTLALLREVGTFKVKVDENGKVVLSGQAGILTFQGDTALKQLGAKLRFASIEFKNGDGFKIDYKATFHFSAAASISISGSFDIEELILSCSGLLCQAARALEGRQQFYDRELQRIMGE